MKEILSATDFLDSLQPRVGFQTNAIYRGLDDETHSLTPGLFRLSNLPPDIVSWTKLERALLSEFRRQSLPHIESAPRTMIEWIALAQHYGLPTRLLDWTENPLVALFFAVGDASKTTTSAVWRLETTKLWEDHTQWTNFPQSYHELSLNKGTKVYHPAYLSKRVVAQRGCFTVHNDFPADFAPFVPFEVAVNGLKAPGITLTKYTIPVYARNLVRLELDSMGVDPYTIFPDLDGVCRKLRWSLCRERIVADIRAMGERTDKASPVKESEDSGRMA